MQPEALNCPNCGAAVSSDRTQCEFCKSRLKTVACPSCLGVMFLGSKFCGRCGAHAVDAEVVADEKVGACPRCKIGLQSLKIGATSLRECLRCGGFWSTVETFENVCADKERQSAVINYAAAKSRAADAAAAIAYVPCPDCKQLMNRSNFARSSGVIIDLCKKHGVWFDADELPKIIDFINEGGLAHSREREKIALEEERGRLRDDQRRMARIESRSGGGRSGADDEESGFGRVIAALFDL
ncbi:MAG: zinc ribbon domain-containing protein [Acidobacteriota bacterium]